jgi:cell cycle arrest protein BUB3
MSAAAAPSAMGSGRELADPPSDGISNLRFSNHSNNLLVSSWDKVGTPDISPFPSFPRFVKP